MTALLFRVFRQDGKVQEIQVFVTTIGMTKVSLVRDKSFKRDTDENDFSFLMKAVSLTE